MEIPDINIEDLLRNSKIRINQEQSEEVQAVIYSMGGGWSPQPDFQIRNEDVPFLFIDKSLLLHPGRSEAQYFLSAYREISFNELQIIAFEYYSNLF